jgi:hypothetical protein
MNTYSVELKEQKLKNNTAATITTTTAFSLPCLLPVTSTFSHVSKEIGLALATPKVKMQIH